MKHTGMKIHPCMQLSVYCVALFGKQYMVTAAHTVLPEGRIKAKYSLRAFLFPFA